MRFLIAGSSGARDDAMYLSELGKSMKQSQLVLVLTSNLYVCIIPQVAGRLDVSFVSDGQ